MRRRSSWLFRSLLCVALVSGAFACKHGPSEKQQQGAQIHYDLGIQAQQAGAVQDALREFQESLKLDPNFPEAHNAMAILLHLSFRRLDEAIDHYRQAIRIRPTFSEAKTNLANVYLDQARYDDAITLYEQALNDMLYPTPYIAQANLGWALYKKGETSRAIEQIRAAVTTNPKFCLGYRNLGLIFDERGDTQEACRQLTHYRESCPEVADAYFREGVCLAKLGQKDTARERFKTCQEKATSVSVQDDCRMYEERLK
jgi:type IV pilus assembly protein PilF